MINLAIAVRLAFDDGMNSPEGWHRFVTWPEGITAWAIIFTLSAIIWQAVETRRAAQATQQIVKDGKDTSKRQLRAYLAVEVGEPVAQTPHGTLKFETRPKIINNGQTPAYKVRFSAKAGILPTPLPKEMVLPDPATEIAGGPIGSGEDMILTEVVEDLVDDAEVENIKAAKNGKALHVWGTVKYEDTFGEAHYTRFCQQYVWLPPNQVHGLYVPGRNDAD